MSHFFYLSFVLIKNHSIGKSEINSFEGVSSPIYKTMPPPFACLSNLYGVA